MNTLNAVMFSLLSLMAIFIEIKLFIANNGDMRKRLLEFFGSELWAVIGWLLFECSVYGQDVVSVFQWFLFILYFPKLISKFRFCIHVIKYY